MVDELVVELAGKQVGDNLTDSSGELMELSVLDDDGIQTELASQLSLNFLMTFLTN